MNNPYLSVEKKKTHHPVGIISLALAILMGAVTLLIFGLSMIPESGTYASQRYNNFLLITGLGIAPIFHFVGLVLGIIGAFLKESKKVFPILGIVLNLLPLAAAALIWILLFWVIWAVLVSGSAWK